MATCRCRCGRDLDCGETECGICEPVEVRTDGLPNGMTENDYTMEET